MKKISMIAVVAVVSTGCGLGGGAGKKFVGLYSPSGSTTLTFNNNGQTQSINIKASSARGITEDEVADIVIGWDACMLPAQVDDNIATFQAGHLCRIEQDGAVIAFTVKTGSVSYSKNSLSMQVTGDVSLTMFGKTVTGTFSGIETLTRVGK